MSTQLSFPARRRLELVRSAGTLNGIDFVEVLASRRTLLVHCVRPLAELDERNILIEGGVRVRGVKAEWASRADLVAGRLRAEEQARVDQLDDPTAVLVVRTTSSGDFSTYRLLLVGIRDRPAEPAAGFDELLSTATFSFKVDCPSEFDCAPAHQCDHIEPAAPHIDYLAKDYSSFRRLILDRLAVLVPDWGERNAADTLMTLVELLAHAGDSLSYFQDAAATEAYLGTARRRASVRRHARLVDYAVHDGASARAWLAIDVDSDGELPRGTMVLTGEVGADAVIAAAEVGEALTRGALVFETLHAAPLFASRNAIDLYDWGDESACLPAGATQATLVGTAADLALTAGDLLVFEEVRDPGSSAKVDADPAHRHVVRIAADPVPRQDTVTAPAIDLVEISWRGEDALPFAARLRTDTGDAACRVRGNVVLADHGGTTLDTQGKVQREKIGAAVDGRLFRPRLARQPVTQSQPYDDRAARRLPAAAATRVEPQHAVAAVAVYAEGERWEPVRELLNSDRFAADFVIETEEDGSARIRFGDGILGRKPVPEKEFVASYRVGTGLAGNVGVDALTRIVTDLAVTSVSNPLPATGGSDPEPLEHARFYAPQAFRTQKRAVTEADYAAFAERHPEVQRAGATRRWTGSWNTIFITVDRLGGREIDDVFEDELRAFLDPFRLGGHDIEIDGPAFVPLELHLSVNVAPQFVRTDVHAALLEAFSSSMPSGFFHPDRFTFAQPVYVSGIVAAAMGVVGVEWVEVTAFHRYGEPARSELADGELRLGRLEVARLDNDPNRPENGRIEIELRGGL